MSEMEEQMPNEQEMLQMAHERIDILQAQLAAAEMQVTALREKLHNLRKSALAALEIL